MKEHVRNVRRVGSMHVIRRRGESLTLPLTTIHQRHHQPQSDESKKEESINEETSTTEETN